MPCLLFVFTSSLWVRVGGVVSASFSYVSFISWFPFSFLGCPTVLLSTGLSHSFFLPILFISIFFCFSLSVFVIQPINCLLFQRLGWQFALLVAASYLWRLCFFLFRFLFLLLALYWFFIVYHAVLISCF